MSVCQNDPNVHNFVVNLPPHGAPLRSRLLGQSCSRAAPGVPVCLAYSLAVRDVVPRHIHTHLRHSHRFGISNFASSQIFYYTSLQRHR